MVKIGSNNAMTYLRPSSWWSNFFACLGRCQTYSYDKQYEYWNVRMFDLRLYADDNLRIIARNGRFKYPIFSLYEILNFFDKKCDVLIRITFEDTYGDVINDASYNAISRKFKKVCKILETIYPNIKYFGGYRTCDGKQLYTFNYERKNGTPNIIDVSNNHWIYRLFPRLASLRNKKNIEKYKNEDGYLLLNFVEKQ